MNQQLHLGKSQMEIYSPMLVDTVFSDVKYFLYVLAPAQYDVLCYIYQQSNLEVHD
jgi:hypothetical protein